VRKARDRLTTIQSHLHKQTEEQRTDVIGVIHRKCHTLAFEIIHVQRGGLTTALGRIHELELPGTRRDKVSRTVLVAERVAANDDGLDPTGDRTGDALEDDWLAKYGSAEDVADLHARTRKEPRQEESRRWSGRTYGAIGRAPHLLQLKFFYACLVRRDGCALDADVVFEDRFGRLDRHSVIGLPNARGTPSRTGERAGGRRGGTTASM